MVAYITEGIGAMRAIKYIHTLKSILKIQTKMLVID